MRPIRVETRFFIDSNVLLYTFGHDAKKLGKAKDLVNQRPIISVQTLNEFANVCRKKFKLEWADISAGLETAKSLCDVVPLTIDVHEKAAEFASLNRIGIYDANIVAAAELSGCEVLYTEDLSHGQRIGRVLIQNPFLTV
jgi:predicted nucleic acid-binding protein